MGLISRHLGKILLGLSLALATAVVVWWWWSTSGPDYLLRCGREALNEDQAEKAERQALRLEAAGHKDHAHLLRGEIAVKEKDYVRALAELNQIRDQGAIRLEAAVLVGHCHLQLGVPLQAERAYLFVLEQQPNRLEAHRDLAALYYDQGALMRAVKHCEEWARLSPKDGRPYRFIAFIYRGLELNEDAVSNYQAALRLDLDDPVRQLVHVELAECLIKRGEFQQALETLEQCQPPALQTIPEDLVKVAVKNFLARKWTLTAEGRRGLGQTGEALGFLTKALAADPDYADALRLRANFHLDAGEAQAAAQLLERAVRHDPHDFAARDRLAQAYASLGKTAEAQEERAKLKETQKLLQDLKKANQDVQASPRDGTLHARLAEIYEKLDRRADAERSRRNAQYFSAEAAPKK